MNLTGVPSSVLAELRSMSAMAELGPVCLIWIGFSKEMPWALPLSW
jgi:hypothetical protein